MSFVAVDCVYTANASWETLIGCTYSGYNVYTPVEMASFCDGKKKIYNSI